MKRVAITGMNGFTGQYICKELIVRGISPVPILADIRDKTALAAEIKSKQFDACIHLAGVAFTNSWSWQDFYDVNLIGSTNLLETISKTHPNVRCIVVSSAQVYGSQPSGLISETAICKPQNAYAVSKLALEHSAKIWSNFLDIQIVRPFNYTGIGQEDRYLIPKIINHFAKRLPSIELGNISVRRDFGDVRSVARIYCDLLNCNNPKPDLNCSGAVNVATGSVWSINDILAALTSLSGHSIEVKINPEFVRLDEVDVLGGAVEKLRYMCPEWSPTPFQETLQWMLDDATVKNAN